MNEKKIIKIVSLTILVLVCLTLLLFALNPSLEQTMEVRGYKISIPNKWSYDSKGNIYDKNGNAVGTFTLTDSNQISENDNRSVEIAENIIKYDDYSKDSTQGILYSISNLPNPEPYGAKIVFYDGYVREGLADKIVKTFTIPQLGANPPQKNIKEPDEESSVIKIEFEDESVVVKNTNLLSEFSEKQSKKENFGINVLSYEEKDGKKSISSWKYLESHNGVGYVYTYYQKGENIYTYDNNPLCFVEISKVISEEDSTTSYYIKNEEKEDCMLIDFPLNRYRDNAKELIALKTDNAKSADIQQILNKILNGQELKNSTFKFKERNLSISFSEDVMPDEKKAYSHSAVIFGLVGNVDIIKISYSDGKVFSYTREQIEKALNEKTDSVVSDEKTFVDYTEKIEQEQTNDGEVVYTGTVTVSYDTLVTHPKTGERVKIGPYAERMGFSKYLNVPIQCVIKRSGSGYVATAHSNGKTITTYPLENEARLNWAINLINSYS